MQVKILVGDDASVSEWMTRARWLLLRAGWSSRLRTPPLLIRPWSWLLLRLRGPITITITITICAPASRGHVNLVSRCLIRALCKEALGESSDERPNVNLGSGDLEVVVVVVGGGREDL